MPESLSELGGYTTPDDGEEPFFCLLQDDKLISHVSVETDVLLEQIDGGYDVNDARLVISVTLRPYHVIISNVGFT